MSGIRLENLTLVIGIDSGDAVAIDMGGDRIINVGGGGGAPGETIDCSGLTAWPGFIDVHIHGAVGIDVNAADVDALLEVARFLARHGVTSWLPTLVPDSDENYGRVISTIDALMERQSGEPIAQAVGVHYEGVFANEQMCGALRPEFFKAFTGTSPTTPSSLRSATPPRAGGELAELPRLKSGVHMTTFAPEIEGGIELTRELQSQGWVASIGHTRADVDTLDRAFDAGARHVTHFFNAMTGMHHRDVGVVGWALANREVTFDIIADGVHVHPSMLELACRTKSIEQVSLISDSVAPTGLGDGEFSIWGERVTVDSGRTRNERGSIAGSVITMLDAVRRMRSLGFTDAEVSRMASLNPARLLSLDSDRGLIKAGKRADLVLLDPNGEVRLTMIGGKIAYDAR